MAGTRWPPPTLQDSQHFMGSPPIPSWREVAPLWILPVEHRDRIEMLVLAERPPAKRIQLSGLAQIIRIDPFHRDRLPPGMRQMVIDRDGLRCGLCGGSVEYAEIQIDHIHPRSLGGPDELNNLQVAHARCNASKGNRI